MRSFFYLTLIGVVTLGYGCDKQKRFAVKTEDPVEVSACRATFKATGENGDSKKISEKGFCYSSEKIPEYGDNNTPSKTDPFEAEVLELTAKTKYYVRAYTKLTDGTLIMGNNIEFSTTDVYKVGDTGPAKGYIFSSNPSAGSDKYSECMVVNTAPLEWGCYGQELPSITLTGSGLANTTKIADACGPNTAAAYCLNYTINKYSDWYLPTVGELSIVYSFAQANPGKIPPDRYLSSSQSDYILCYGMDFKTSNEWIKMAKSIGRNVIAVRSFN